jgi:hypothetical protein
MKKYRVIDLQGSRSPVEIEGDFDAVALRPRIAAGYEDAGRFGDRVIVEEVG